MFQKMKNVHGISKVAAQFLSATGIDPGDDGQVLRKAMEYASNLAMDPHDAWLAAIVNWMDGMPWPDSKELLAKGILGFLDEYESRVPFSRTTVLSARQAISEALS